MSFDGIVYSGLSFSGYSTLTNTPSHYNRQTSHDTEMYLSKRKQST